MTAKLPNKLLIIDDEEDLRDVITLAIETRFKINVLTANSGNQAIQILKNITNITGIVCDYAMADGTGGDVFNYIKSKNLRIPFILCGNDPLSSYPEFKDGNEATFLQKPFGWEDLISKVEQYFFPNSAGVTKNKSAYCAVNLRSLTKVNVLEGDLFIRLSDTKYIKIMNEKDIFTQEDFDKYSSKKIDTLYMERKGFETFLAKFLLDIANLSEIRRIPWDQSYENLDSSFVFVYEGIKALGFTEESQELAKATARLAVKTIMTNKSLSDLFKGKLINPNGYLKTHSTILMQTCCLLATKLHWNSEMTQYKLSLAALMHDLTIKDPTTYTIELYLNSPEVTENFSSEQIKEFKSHPEEGAKLAREMRRAPADLDQIILQHHERPDGTGFPLGLDSRELSPLPTLFIVAHDVVNFMWLKKGRATLAEFVQAYTKEYKSDSFKRIISSLGKVTPT